MFYSLIRFLAIVLCKILFRLEARGRENVPAAGGFILAGNHTSYLDPIVLAASSPRQLNFMARDDLFKIPIFGPFIRSVRAFPLKRDSVGIAGMKQALHCLDDSGGLLIFPEGGRTSGELAIQAAKPGISFIAAKSRLPVVPAFVSGAQRAFGRGAHFIKPAKIRVYFGKPLYFENNDLKNGYAGFAGRVMQEIKELNRQAAC